MHIAELVRHNKGLLNFDIFLEVTAEKDFPPIFYLQQNNDNVTRQRVCMDLIELPAPQRANVADYRDRPESQRG